MKRLLIVAMVLALAGVAHAFGGNSGAPNINNLPGTPLTAANGGTGAMTAAPMWARNFGDGSDGAGPASGALNNGFYNYTTWDCTGAITHSANRALIIRATTSVIIDTGCSITSTPANSALLCDYGGAGGSGGSGAANSSASKICIPYNPTAGVANSIYAISAAAAASSAGAGNDGGVISADNLRGLLFAGPNNIMEGGGAGTQGGSTGGAAGNGNQPIVIISPTITVASGAIIDSGGAPGVQAAANSTGAGGGGGAGPIWLFSETFTDNGGTYKYGGGPGGACQQPSIQAIGGGCDTTGCGKDAVFTITALSGGGLSAGSITVTNAGTGYKTAPGCKINAGTSGLTGSPACHFAAPVAGALAAPVIDTAGSGGVLTTFTTCFVGGYGANAWMWQQLIQ